MSRSVHDIAIARSGDKGNRATLSVIALDPADYPLLAHTLTAEVVARHYAGIVQGPVRRFELPALAALQFTLDAALGGGVTRSLALDAHGKSLASAVLTIPLAEPAAPAAPAAYTAAPGTAPAPSGDTA